MTKINHIYIHVPFCQRVCPYCDFYKTTSFKLIPEYLEALKKELQIKKELFGSVRTLYIGGGTPSSIGEYLSRFFEIISKAFDMEKLSEFTIEVNPEDVTEELIETLQKHGVNRISLGVQSFSKEKQKFLNRQTPSVNKNALKLLKDFPNVSCDLIYGIYRDTISKLKSDVKIIKRYNVKHLSFYSLIIEENTKFYKDYHSGKKIKLSEDKETRIYHKMVKYIEKLGYKQYEISNFAVPGFESKHNLCYWHYDDFLNFGPGAVGFYSGSRYENPKSLHEYSKEFPKDFYLKEKLSFKDEEEEFVMMGLRLKEGVSILKFKERFGEDIFTAFPKFKEAVSKKHIIFENDHLCIDPKYFYVSNHIIKEVLDWQ